MENCVNPAILSGMIGRHLKHYLIEDVLGKGGMGTVYKARDTRLQRPVALKVLPLDVTADPEHRQRFFQEARAAAAINHPSVAQVYDVDEADGTTFIAMEFVEGQTVRQLILGRELDLLAAVDIAIQVGEGLARAHDSGIVHRDIKSENIMVTRDGHAKVLDFGLAKLDPMRSQESEQADRGKDEERMSQLATMAMTRSGMVVGTVAYMSPEQARGKPVDFRSDIFSLGVTLYEMAAGCLPFSGESPLDTMHAIAFEETRPITALRPNMPPELQRIISRCLRKKAEDRYPSTSALVDDLRTLRRNVDSGYTRSVPLVDSFRTRFASLRLSARPLLVVGVILVCLLISALIVFMYQKRIDFWPLGLAAVVALLAYRRYRNRDARLMKRFSARASKLPEVRLVAFSGRRAVVVVDRMQAKTYLRIHGAVDSINRKLFFGEPMSVDVRDDASLEELRRMLKEPGITYFREDVVE